MYDFYFNSEDKDRKDEVEEYFVTLSKKCSNINKNKDAIKCCDYYLDKGVDSSKILKLKIELLSHLKRFDDALNCYDILVNIDDDSKSYSSSRLDHILCLEAKAFYSHRHSRWIIYA